MTKEEIRRALEQPGKESRKALAKLAMELELDAPQTYKEILQREDWTGDALESYRAYRRACVLSRVAMVLAALTVIATVIVGDFGLALIEGWLKRYTMALGVIIAMGLFAGGALLLNRYKERLIAYALMEAEEDEKTE